MDQLFSNREIAVFFWALIFLSWAFTKKEIRDSAKHVLLAFCHRKILTIFALMGVYVYLIVASLRSMGIWDFDQLKNTILWFVFVASIELFKANTIHQEEGYFKKSIKGHLKLLVILEFIVGIQSFSLIVEFIIVPILSIAVLILAFSELKKEYKPVENLMSWVLAIFGVFMVGSGLYFISSNFGEFAQEKTFLDFITPIFLSISLLPFIFIFFVYILYENILVRINIYTDNRIHRLYGKFKGLVHFKRDHKGLNDWLAFACISDFKSIKAIDQSIITFNIREKELV